MSDPKDDLSGRVDELARRVDRLEKQNRERGYLSEADEKADADRRAREAEESDGKATAGNKPKRRRLPG